MYLKKLEISGFKSFASKTTLDFLIDAKNGKNQGITAIVGPNGSGKSNIADALRWVMGEQSMKNLRGKKSEDIIFAGSGKKARLGSAHVTLYLDNSDKKIPLEFEEVSVTRKIFRSGESEYLINGSRVRLQDVIDILAKAGVGKESYAVVNQGMADSVLSAAPAERRIMIEDAAGVKQYQIKKERSIRKLHSTHQNLERVRELIEEIKPHLRMLKRQADKAAQSEGVAQELLENQTKLFSYLWHNFQQERNKLNEEKEEIGRVLNNIQREADKLTDEINKEAKNEKDSQKQTDLENKQRELRNKLNQLEKELIITEGRIEIEKEKQKNVEMIKEAEVVLPQEETVDKAYIKEKLEEIKKDQEKLIEKIEKAEKMEDLQDIKEFARVIGQRLYDLKAEINEGKIKLRPDSAEQENKIKDEKPEINKTEKVIEESQVLIELQKRIIKIREEIKSAEEEIERIESEIQKEIALDREKRRNFFEVERKLRAKQEEINKLRDKFNDAKISLAKVEVHEDDLKNQIKTELKKEAQELAPIKGEVDPGILNQEIYKLKIKMEQIGGIDPMVVDEYNETQKRFEFLSGELEDLENAITSLQEVIKEMDSKIGDKFASTYDEINKEFTKYFRIIFGGGNAHLTKVKIKSRRSKAEEENTEEEGEGEKDKIDKLEEDLEKKEEEREEIGIDIFACPPGKKIASLAVLSGGERSLTSLALLFAIISHNPPPFAILDEVEAALDEANSRRFGRILTELSSNTQFVTITHNRETMRQAALLYGVTMSEDGVSKLLSVRLDQIGQGGKIINKS